MTVEDLERKVAELWGIPADQVLLLLRHEPITISATPRVELFNMDWARLKKLVDVRSQLDQGRMIFAETGTLKTVPFEKMHWYRAITGSEDVLRLHITTKGFDRDFVDVKINRNKTL